MTITHGRGKTLAYVSRKWDRQFMNMNDHVCICFKMFPRQFSNS